MLYCYVYIYVHVLGLVKESKLIKMHGISNLKCDIMLLWGLASTKFPLRRFCFQTTKNMVPMSRQKCSAPRLNQGMLAASSIKKNTGPVTHTDMKQIDAELMIIFSASHIF